MLGYTHRVCPQMQGSGPEPGSHLTFGASSLAPFFQVYSWLNTYFQ